LVWTLFDGGYTAGRIDAADAGVRQATLALQQVENGVELEVRQAYLNVGQASAQVDASRQLVALAEENQRLAQVRYRGGVGTALELQDAELRADAARETLVGAEVALREGVSHLRFAAGML
jgi:outer membrane protein TolC